MRGRRLVLFLGVLLVAPALAGCASESPGTTSDPTRASAPVVDTGSSTDAPIVKPKTSSERWHFHDYWKGNPQIKLLEANVTFNVTPVGGDGLPGLSAMLEFPNGVIVPAETGYLTVNITWPDTTPGGAVNLTYRPADSQGFFALGNLTNGKPGQINTTESMCDVPHRQQSNWKFNLTATTDGVPPTPPPGTVHVTIVATIGRPLFIDPPHLNWWTQDVIPLIEGAKGEIATATTPAGNITLPVSTGAPPAPPTAQAVHSDVRVNVDEGRIVPEGTVTMVAMLNWTSEVPNAPKLMLRYKESNLPSEGAFKVAKESGSSRIFVLSVAPPQTDTTYSNRTTWEMHIVPDGGSNTAFQGTFTLVVWATRLAPDEAVLAVTGA